MAHIQPLAFLKGHDQPQCNDCICLRCGPEAAFEESS